MHPTNCRACFLNLTPCIYFQYLCDKKKTAGLLLRRFHTSVDTSMYYSRFIFICAMLVLVLGAVPVFAAAFTLSPAQMANTYTGNLTMAMTGVTPGQQVIVEQYSDFNGNAAVDATDFLMQSFRVTDGAVPWVAGRRNSLMIGDEDRAANGVIQAVIDCRYTDAVNRVQGKYITNYAVPTARCWPRNRFASPMPLMPSA